ncbi:Fe-S cluster assembly ATPase SufC [Candidatus Pinguicoccus supinus]|uniref:Fe-S cluster assembly ATPase SufC n=1 Tax=Candidatus Pinguicoccus supinus TaxID=2529394 RepID=A0A7T0BRF1_9BACT|nr:Fe-S cluster assembly ATPase SufC [Candidatus Pinguicoccus supinus]
MGLFVENLTVSIKNKIILNSVCADFNTGGINLLMGPNGSGKSTFLKVIAGDPDYDIVKGQIIYENNEIHTLDVQKIAQLGVFLAFQHPVPLPGISVIGFLKSIAQSYHRNILKKDFNLRSFYKKLELNLSFLNMDDTYLNKEVNVEFSGGEKKKLEILQMLILNPKLILLDEVDSGLDVDSIKIIAKGINKMFELGSRIILVTHYKNILKHITPSRVYVMNKGSVVCTGGLELAHTIYTKGYSAIL